MTTLYKVLEEGSPETFPKTPDLDAPEPSGTSKQATSLEVIEAASPGVAVEDPNAVVSVRNNGELLRRENGPSYVSHYDYFVKARDVPGVKQRFVQSAKLHQWGLEVPLPAHPESYDSTEDLFGLIEGFITDHAGLADEDSTLLTFWVFSTWFKDAVFVAPPLFITGSAHEGDIVLRTLHALCFTPILIPGLKNLRDKDVPWELGPTLLVYEPNLNKTMSALIACSTSPGYCTSTKGAIFDHYGPRAFYVGETIPANPLPPRCLQINASASHIAAPQDILSLPMKSSEQYRNQLHKYRVTNLLRVGASASALTVPGLSSEKQAIANALGRCIIDAPALQAELIAHLTEHALQETDERRDSLEGSVLEAALHLCHEGKTQVYVKEIAAEVDRMRGGRGQNLKLSAEKAGHLLKKLGLHSRRLDKAGNGLILDLAARVRLHDVAACYLDAGSMLAEENLHCDLCEKPQPLAQVV